LEYSGKGAAATMFVAQLAATAYLLFSPELVSAEAMQYLQAGAGVLGVASKLPQILAIYQQGGTGQLSAFAVSSWNEAMPTCTNKTIGLQLPCWLSLSNLHNPPRG